MLDGHGIGVRIKIRRGLILRNPAAENLVNYRHLTGLVEDFDDQVLTEILKRDFLPKARAEIPNLVCPLLKVRVVGHASFKRDRIILRAARRFAATARIASLAVLHDLGGPLEGADLADSSYGCGNAFEKDLKLKVLIGVETISTKLSHSSSLDLDLTGHLLDFDDHKLGRFEGREADMNIDDTQVDVILGRGVFVTLNEVGLSG